MECELTKETNYSSPFSREMKSVLELSRSKSENLPSIQEIVDANARSTAWLAAMAPQIFEVAPDMKTTVSLKEIQERWIELCYSLPAIKRHNEKNSTSNTDYDPNEINSRWQKLNERLSQTNFYKSEDSAKLKASALANISSKNITDKQSEEDLIKKQLLELTDMTRFTVVFNKPLSEYNLKENGRDNLVNYTNQMISNFCACGATLVDIDPKYYVSGYSDLTLKFSLEIYPGINKIVEVQIHTKQGLEAKEKDNIYPERKKIAGKFGKDLNLKNDFRPKVLDSWIEEAENKGIIQQQINDFLSKDHQRINDNFKLHFVSKLKESLPSQKEQTTFELPEDIEERFCYAIIRYYQKILDSREHYKEAKPVIESLEDAFYVKEWIARHYANLKVSCKSSPYESHSVIETTGNCAYCGLKLNFKTA